jgi:hypothetical protein
MAVKPGPLKIAMGLGFAGALLYAFGRTTDGNVSEDPMSREPLVLVPATLTPLEETEAAKILREAFYRLEQRYPSDDELAMALSQSALETAKWTKMFCGNWGNSVTSHGPYFQLGNDTKHRYRAFNSVEDGARQWLLVLKNAFPLSWELLGSADTSAYAISLKGGKYGEYYEAPTSQYIKALNSHYAHMLGIAQNVTNTPSA